MSSCARSTRRGGPPGASLAGDTATYGALGAAAAGGLAGAAAGAALGAGAAQEPAGQPTFLPPPRLRLRGRPGQVRACPRICDLSKARLFTRNRLIALGVIALIGAGVAAWALTRPAQVEVPSVLEQTGDVATTALEQRGFEVEDRRSRNARRRTRSPSRTRSPGRRPTRARR